MASFREVGFGIEIENVDQKVADEFKLKNIKKRSALFL